MNKHLAALLAAKKAKVDAARAILNAADGNAENPGQLNAEQQAAYDSALAEIATLDVRIAREQELATAEANLGAVTVLNPNAAGSIVVSPPRQHNDATGGFAAFGEFLRATVQAGATRGRQVDDRLVFQSAAPGSGMNEGTGADGGYLVPPEFSRAVWQLMQNPLSVLPLTDNVDVTGNSMSFLKDVSTPWGTDGVQAYWQAELAAGTVSRPKLARDQMFLEKLMVLVPVSEEMMQDGAALETYLRPKMAEKIQWKYEDAFFHAAGAGMPKGFMQGGGVVEVTKTAGFTYSATAAISVEDLGAMMARMPASWYARAVWHIHTSLWPSLIKLAIANQPVFTPPTAGIQNAPGGSLLGRPLMPSEHCKAPTVKGDIVLADWKGYRTITKAGGMQTATSMHLYFDADATAFRVTYRINGEPILTAPVSPANGSDTLSHFVILDDTR